MKKISKVDVLSLASFLAAAHLVAGLVIGLVVTALAAYNGTINVHGSGRNIFETAGYVTVLVWPLVLAVTGFIAGVIYGWAYNVVAKWNGGVIVKLDDTEVHR